MKFLLYFFTLSLFFKPLYAGIIINDGVLVSDGRLLQQFFISKMNNSNRVMYSLEVDQNCQFMGKKPIYPYWQMLEINEEYYENLNFVERQFFNLGESRVEGNSFKFQIKVFNQITALKNKVFTTKIEQDGDVCVAKTFGNIENHDLEILSVHAYNSGMSVSKLDIWGIDLKTGEKIKITILKNALEDWGILE